MKQDRQIINTNIRLNLAREADRRAWEHLQQLDRQQYKSYSSAVVAAVNYFFDRQAQLADDPYLETRAKAEAFLQSVRNTIRQELQATAPAIGLLQLLQGVQPALPQAEVPDDADTHAALDFADSF